VTDNQGDWLPSSKLVVLREGAFYGSRAVDPEGSAGLRVTPPAVWLPQDEIGNSPSQPVPFSKGPYRDQILFGDVTHGGIKRAVLEEVEGVMQGAVLRFTQGLEAGVNRLAWGPDGKLYAGGIGNPGNWNSPGQEWAGLQRLAYNGRPTFEMLAVRARTDGFEIELTEALAAGSQPSLEDFTITQWRYAPTADYGGPKVDLLTLPVREVEIDGERRRLFLAVDGLASDRVVHLRLRHGAFESARGAELWSTEAWYTLNEIPAERSGPSFAARGAP
jgi:cytochrome c